MAQNPVKREIEKKGCGRLDINAVLFKIPTAVPGFSSSASRKDSTIETSS